MLTVDCFRRRDSRLDSAHNTVLGVFVVIVVVVVVVVGGGGGGGGGGAGVG